MQIRFERIRFQDRFHIVPGIAPLIMLKIHIHPRCAEVQIVGILLEYIVDHCQCAIVLFLTHKQIDKALFYHNVVRIDLQEDLLSGTAAVVSTSGLGDAALTVIEDLTGNFRWNGVAVGDTLVVTTAGADYGRHEIRQVGELAVGGPADRDTRLSIFGTLTGPFDYRVERQLLRENPVLTITDLATTAGSQLVTTAAGGLLLVDEGKLSLRLLTGANAGEEIEVIDIISDTQLVLRSALQATEAPVDAELLTPGAFEDGEARDEDWELEALCAADAPKIVVLEPRTLIVSVVDLTLDNDTSDPDPANWTATASPWAPASSSTAAPSGTRWAMPRRPRWPD